MCYHKNGWYSITGLSSNSKYLRSWNIRLIEIYNFHINQTLQPYLETVYQSINFNKQRNVSYKIFFQGSQWFEQPQFPDFSILSSLKRILIFQTLVWNVYWFSTNFSLVFNYFYQLFLTLINRNSRNIMILSKKN